MLQRKVDNLDAIAPDARKRPDLRLVNETDTPVQSAAHSLQDEIARVFAQESTWSVRRTVAIGIAFHVVVLCALGLAASGAILPH